ncbi:hypothetical protein EDD15DRAFT_2206934 [Pisolithus albus]|nr:hypothetical protein EDD15DRAFT_2206934 [Pisolithus albus]
MLLEEGYRFELREAHFARDQWSAREAQCKAEMRELRAVWTEEQCRGLEKCSESARLGSKASQPPSSTSLEIQSLTHNLQDSSKPSKVPGVGSRSQAVEVDGIEVAVAEPSSLALVEGRCESSFDQIQVTSYIAKESLTAELQGECLRGNLEEKSEEKPWFPNPSISILLRHPVLIFPLRTLPSSADMPKTSEAGNRA